MVGVVGWGVDVVVGVVSRVFCVQNGTWCAVCGVGAADMHRLCFLIATCLMCMGMGGGACMQSVARLGGCRLWVGGASPHKLCEGGHWAHKLVCGRRVWATASAQLMFSDIYICHDHVHV